jgi:hypothetical protein
MPIPSLRRSLAATAVAVLVAASSLSAQDATPRRIQWSARLAATASTKLLEDQVITPIDIKVGRAWGGLVSASYPIDSAGHRADLEVAYTSGPYSRLENDTTTKLGTLRTATVTAGVEGLVSGDFWWRVGVGFLAYLPSEKTGIFQDGAPTRLVYAAGLEYRRPLSGGWTVNVAARYDYHNFITQHLKNEGYGGAQGVHRLTLSLGVGR